MSVKATGAVIRHGGDKAYYAPHADLIQMPPFASFQNAVKFYATLAHEETHWTSYKTRLDRDLGRKRFGDEGCAMEELVAELGSVFLCADLGISPEIMDGHAGYLESWLRVMKGDKRAIFTAAALAEKAVAYLHGLQGVGAESEVA